jgi:hypothetical protein
MIIQDSSTIQQALFRFHCNPPRCQTGFIQLECTFIACSGIILVNAANPLLYLTGESFDALFHMRRRYHILGRICR